MKRRCCESRRSEKQVKYAGHVADEACPRKPFSARLLCWRPTRCSISLTVYSATYSTAAAPWGLALPL
ncbi:hypothetical protein KCP77_03130 [Salmonella enterica subsp. enterica]|nr:hypothetical protein KCP77_03130 [Salmonella enterica subsp. enterica]